MRIEIASNAIEHAFNQTVPPVFSCKYFDLVCNFCLVFKNIITQ